MASMNTEGEFRNLPDPKDYYQGKGRPPFPLPVNILFFHRRGFDFGQLGIDTNFHYRCVLIFNKGPQVRLMLDGVLRTLQEDDFILLLPYQYHRFLNDGQKSLSLLFATFEMEDDAPLRPLREMPLPIETSHMEMLGEALSLYRVSDEEELSLTMGLLLLRLIRASKKGDETTAPLPSEQTPLVSTICRRLYRDRRLSIGGLSRELGFSEAYLRRSFRQAMGITLGRYILEGRLNEAVRYLRTTDLSISLIAERTGYENISSFTRSFKNHMGLNPSAYRKKTNLR